MIDDILDSNKVVDGDVLVGDDAQSVWLRRAARLFQDSTDYYESSLFSNWRANIAHFRSEHAPGSKYEDVEYKYRSKLFRPKPRSASRTLEATAAAALFTNDDLIAVRATDPNNREQDAAAKLHQALLQHRLETSVPWFMTVVGAYQDTNVYGVCISRQYWDYRQRKKLSYEPAIDEFGNVVIDEDGVPMGYESSANEIIADKPMIDLIAPDNFRFDPAADWRDPCTTSPYLIEKIPMYAGDVQAMMGEGGWHEYTLGQLVAHGSDDKDAGSSVRSAREGRAREDSLQVSNASEYSVVWVHFNIIRDNTGEDYAFYTVGTGLLLTDPSPLQDVDPLGRSRYAIGFSSVEAHRSHPSGTVELTRPLTEMLNDVTNQRHDNVRLVLNKRYAIRRAANIDLGALMRNAPGGGVMMDDVNADYKIMETPDVTQSSYVEQDRLAVEADELLGTFSQASVQSNRSLNQTVGGMNLMSGSANQVQELGLRAFIETWVEPVLRTMVKLESLYETDETVLNIAKGKAELFTAIDDRLMMQDLTVRVNVGMGNTNPKEKLARFMEPLNVAAGLPEFSQEIDFVEVGKEIFALSGQGDGSRFMLTDEKKQARAEAQGGQEDPKVVVEQMRQQMKQMEIELRQMQIEQEGTLGQLRIETDKEIAYARIAADKEIKLTDLYERLGVDKEVMQAKIQLEAQKNQTQRDIAALRSRYDELKTRLQAENLTRGYDTF